MNMTSTQNLLLWAPRIAGLLVAAFLALFALDAFNETGSFVGALPAFAIHLIPSLLVLMVVAIAWRFEWIGAIAFIALAVLYAVMARGRLDWIAVISGPLVLVGVLFLVSWRQHANFHGWSGGSGRGPS
jgi:hypothetical protein